MSFDIKGASFEETKETERLMPRQPSGNERFTLFHTRVGWVFDDESSEWLPQLRQLNHKRGCNGVDARGNANGALAALEGRGHTVLRIGDRRLGKYKNYLKVWPTISGAGVKGTHFATPWESPKVVGGKVIWRRTGKGYRKFLRYLVENDVIGHMTRDVLELKIDAAEDRATRLAKDAQNPVARERYEKALKRIEAMAAAWEKQFSAMEPEVAFDAFDDDGDDFDDSVDFLDEA